MGPNPANGLSPKVIKNYLLSISSLDKVFNVNTTPLSHLSISHYLRSISINSTCRPTPRGVFDIHISRACDNLSDPALYRVILLTAVYGFLGLSNLAPHSSSKFDHKRHLLRQDRFFLRPGVHFLIKWTKTLQDHNSPHHHIHLPEIENIFLCPIRALKALISRPLPPTAPLFAQSSCNLCKLVVTTQMGSNPLSPLTSDLFGIQLI